MEILTLTIGLLFLWHLILRKILPFLSGMFDSESGASLHLAVLALSPFGILIHLIYEKYDTTVANISLAISTIIAIGSHFGIKNFLNGVILKPVISIIYNTVYYIILYIFLDSLLP